MSADFDAKAHLKELRANMQRSVDHFEDELHKIRAGKASPDLIKDLRVDYYGAPTPIEHLSNIQAADARTLTVQPFEKNQIKAIERAIVDANLGLNPSNDGIVIRVILPILTEDRRKQLVKQAKDVAEDARVAVRNLRRDANETIKKMKKDGFAEDAAKTAEADVQKVTDEFVAKIDHLLTEKEKEVMTV
jgi:ribosome recycling factor